MCCVWCSADQLVQLCKGVLGWVFQCLKCVHLLFKRKIQNKKPTVEGANVAFLNDGVFVVGFGVLFFLQLI